VLEAPFFAAWGGIFSVAEEIKRFKTGLSDVFVDFGIV
jgi:hypothetical protein